MKKILLYAVALALPLLFSCNKDKNNDNGSASVPTGGSFNNAGTYGNDQMWASFNADNTFLAGQNVPRVGFACKLMWGTYTYADGTYTMYKNNTQEQWGTLKVLGGNMVEVQIPGEIDDPMKIEVQISKPSVNDNQRAANHTWKPESLTLVYRGVSFSSANGVVDLNAFEDWAVKQGFIKESDKIFDPNMVMQKVILSDSKCCVLFANGEEFAAEITTSDLANFQMTGMTLDGNSAWVPFLEGQASIAFSNGKCILSVKGTYQEESAEAVMTFCL